MTKEFWNEAKKNRPEVEAAAIRLKSAFCELKSAMERHWLHMDIGLPASEILESLEDLQYGALPGQYDKLSAFALAHDAFRKAQLDAVARAEAEFDSMQKSGVGIFRGTI
jgi:hypothetical protein